MSENENDFDALRRLLALKRHEIPPPGYFENFSSQVIGRIRAGETAAELPFLLRFIQWFESRPALPVGFASSLCLVLLYGIVTIQQTPGMAASGWTPQGSNGTIAFQTPPPMSDSQPWTSGHDATNPPAADAAFFSSQPSTPSYQQVGFPLNGN